MKTTILAVVVLAFSTSHAFAVSLAVKLACRDDYFAHCSMHAPGSPGVRQCMRNVGAGLSARCINALADAGMIKGAKKSYAQNAHAKPRVAQAPRAKHVNKQYAAKKAKTYAAKSDRNRSYAVKAERSAKHVSKSRSERRQAKMMRNKRFAARD